jgi:hypothetical protein
VVDGNLRDALKDSTVHPYKVRNCYNINFLVALIFVFVPKKLWFNDKDGYILQYEDLSLAWDNIPIDFHNKLNGRQKSLPKVKNVTFGPRDTWWVSFQDGTARSSQDLPSHIKQQLIQTECLVLDPVNKENYFIFEKNGDFKWQVNDDFDDDMNDSDEDDDVHYIDPQCIRYTQTSINRMSSLTLFC